MIRKIENNQPKVFKQVVTYCQDATSISIILASLFKDNFEKVYSYVSDSDLS